MKRRVAAAVLIAAAAFELFIWSIARRPPRRSFRKMGPEITDDRAAVQKRLNILREIFQSRNDNDPRLDSTFNDMNASERSAFRAEYHAIPAEKRNERGTIVFLLGKNPFPDDWKFFAEVVAEPPCLSLADCGKAGGERGPGDDVTLAYPSLVALKQAQQALEEGRSGVEARAVVAAGLTSKMPAVIRLAEKLNRRFPKP